MAFINDLLGNVENSLIKRFKDSIFVSIIFPITMLVVSFFWTVYSIDRNLIYPKTIDEFAPW